MNNREPRRRFFLGVSLNSLHDHGLLGTAVNLSHFSMCLWNRCSAKWCMRAYRLCASRLCRYLTVILCATACERELTMYLVSLFSPLFFPSLLTSLFPLARSRNAVKRSFWLFFEYHNFFPSCFAYYEFFVYYLGRTASIRRPEGTKARDSAGNYKVNKRYSLRHY